MTELQTRVAAMARLCYEEGLFAGTSGNLSAYDRQTGVMAITPSGVPYPGLLDEDIVLLRFDGTVLEGHYKPSSEWPLHARIYHAMPAVNAVVHTHSVYATAYAAAGKPIPLAIIETALHLGGEVPLAEFSLPGTEAVGHGAVEALRTCPVCLLQNYGLVATGKDLAQAHLRAVYAEDAARISLYATMLGGIAPISPQNADAMRRRGVSM